MHAAVLLAIVLKGLANAHGSHSQKPIVSKDATWMEKHMAEEHHIDSWDAGAFFALHDYNSDGAWQGEEIMRTYGLMDPSNKDMSHDRKMEVLQYLTGLLDKDHDGEVSESEFKTFIDQGETLPDMGTGPGHHGDDEYEYEIHHWEKYHDENTKLEDLTHPEDIEHFKHHEDLERAQEAQEAMDKISIIEDNIPAKFRRH
ncbi:hypothetical protein ED733_005150 [Metarhizium rileyi]|uniref:EF-hand domain-containing protein n=1 Tax=Metarhizium rileyi (strain RCEF 4871) TaxID=1649241 RepID=A0A5C6G8B7_METRR|nr:hypothetical protein ED733_005150 [Metarhizium rileyi]